MLRAGPTTVCQSRPMWVMLGFSNACVHSRPTRHHVMGRALTSFRPPSGDWTVADDEGADMVSDPLRCYDVAVLQGRAWVDLAKEVHQQDYMYHMPPLLGSTSSTTTSSVRVRANAAALMRCLLRAAADSAQVTRVSTGVHRCVAIGHDGHDGHNNVKVEAHAPFTMCTSANGSPVLSVSLLPHTREECTAHVAFVPRSHFHPEHVFGAALLHTAAETADGTADMTTAGDDFLAAYLRIMDALYPELVAWFA